MKNTTALIYNPEIKNYDFGEGHPFRGNRFEYFIKFFKKRTDFDQYFHEIEPQPVANALLELVHDKDYINTIEKASKDKVPDIRKYVSQDNLNPSTGYLPSNIHNPAKIIVGTSVATGELIANGKFNKAIGIGGGLHHAKKSYGEGFCIYNDVAVCIENLKQDYNLERILVLDTDAHAGNGTAEIFYKDPSVLFIDIHQYSPFFYPGTGKINETGDGKAKGFTVNLPVAPGTGNMAYEYIFDNIIFPLAKEFKPELIIRYGGSDPYYNDNLTDLGLTLDGFIMIGNKVRTISEKVCNNKSMDLLASGYNLELLPYVWSALIDGLLGLDINLDGLVEENPPPASAKLKETMDMVEELQSGLKKYWTL